MARRPAAWTLTIALALAAAAPWLRPRWREWKVRAAPRPLDVLLVTLDTTRADRLGCYGSDAGASPNIDALAAGGVTFGQAYAHVPITGPSHSSMMTGLLPPRHGVHDNGTFILTDDIPTLAEQFVAAGYRTGGFVSSFVLDRRFGLARGFAAYEDDVLAGGRDQVTASVRAEVTVDRALHWLKVDDGRPFFAWVHLYDPHAPYEPPEPFSSRFKGRPYEGEIAYMDAQVGRLLGEVSGLRRARPLVVAVMGDHGESLGQHGEMGHAYFIYSATQRVPFILSCPGYLPRKVVAEPLVRGVDLMPTLLDIAGLPIPPDLDGRSLLPIVVGDTAREPGPAYLETYHPRFWWGARELIGLRTGPWLYIRSPRPELYRVDTDAAEESNLASRYPQELASLESRLRGLAGSVDPQARRAPLDAEAESRLKALGYLGAGAPETGGGPLPDAKDNVPLLVSFSRGQDLSDRGRWAEALVAYREAIAVNPRSASVRVLIAECLGRLGKHDEAFTVYADLSRENPESASYLLGMARTLSARKREQEALDLLTEGLRRFPDYAPFLEAAGTVLLDLKRPAEAEKALRRAVTLAPRQIATRMMWGTALIKVGQLEEAAIALREGVEMSPRSNEARDGGRVLAGVAAQLLGDDRYEQARRAYLGVLAAGVETEEDYLNLSLASHRLRRQAESLGFLQRGMARFPASPGLHYRAGRLLQEGGRRPEAEREYQRAIELSPPASPGAEQARSALAGLRGAR